MSLHQLAGFRHHIVEIGLVVNGNHLFGPRQEVVGGLAGASAVPEVDGVDAVLLA